MKSFRQRLIIPIDHGNDTLKFFNHSKILVATGYCRIVIGKRGPYVEFQKSHINFDAFYIPKECVYRLDSNLVYYDEHRSLDKSFTKLYVQKRTVKYADYKVGLCYISPFDLYLENGQKIITEPVDKKIVDNDFFESS